MWLDAREFITLCMTFLCVVQDENDQAVVQKWLKERVQRRQLYVNALRDCHKVCIDRAEEGVNYKASTEKKSVALRFLPINLVSICLLLLTLRFSNS